MARTCSAIAFSRIEGADSEGLGQMRDVIVLGVGQSRFGKFPDRSMVQLGCEAVTNAIRDAGIDGRKIEVAYTSRLYAEMITGQTILKEVGIAGIEMTNIENACAGGAPAVRALWKDIAAGFCDIGIAIGVETMTTSLAGRVITPAKDDLEGNLGLTMPVPFALMARRLRGRQGGTPEDFG